MADSTGGGRAGHDWSAEVFEVLRAKSIRLVATVPDGGLTRLLKLCGAGSGIRVATLSTEEEGIGMLTGAWLGGGRGALLMQSSGVGNCVNTLSLPRLCGTPCLMLVTMRGQWGEFNPWQVPMGGAVRPVFEAMGVHCYPVDDAREVAPTFAAAANFAFASGVSAAVLISQRVIGAKEFR
jgi:sulfopyruvate decarboxylase alpha subunit